MSDSKCYFRGFFRCTPQQRSPRPCALPAAALSEVDSCREKFRTDLESAGVLDFLTNVLQKVYEDYDQSVDALDIIRQLMSNNGPLVTDTEQLKQEIAALHHKIAMLTEENEKLKQKIEQSKVVVVDENNNSGASP